MTREMPDEAVLNQYGHRRISDRQINELIGLARGLCADDFLNRSEVEFLGKWLAANIGVSGDPLIATLYRRVGEILNDGEFDADEQKELFQTLSSFSRVDFELGEALKSTTLPLCNPAPQLTFAGRSYCFTGTFNFGKRHECEKAVLDYGAEVGSLTRKTNVLVIGTYVTESWKHSSFGNKILKACEMRDAGVPISIVSEDHWVSHL